MLLRHLTGGIGEGGRAKPAGGKRERLKKRAVNRPVTVEAR